MATVQELEQKLQAAFDRQDATKAAFDQAQQQENAAYSKYQAVIAQQGTGATLKEITSLRNQVSADPNNSALQAQLAAAQASMKEKQAVIAAARSEYETAQGAAQAAKQPYLDAYSDADEINQDLEQLKQQQVEQAKEAETSADAVKEETKTAEEEPPTKLSGEEKTNLEESEKPADAIVNNNETATDASKLEETPTDNSLVEEKKVVSIEDTTREKAKARPNVLHDFANSTYLLSLHLLDKHEFNKIADQQRAGEKIKFKSTNVLISSGGRQTNRNPAFGENFFLENLEMNTIIGLTAVTQGTNAVTVKFNIVEPNGCSLIERLLLASTDANYANYLEMAYALQIEFIGYDENGNIKTLPNHSKFVPIKIATIAFKVSERGTEYTVTAVPYNHVAFNKLSAAAPVTLSITAGTVSEYFSDNGESEAFKKRKEERETEDGMSLLTEKRPALAASWCNAVNKNERQKSEEIQIKDSNNNVYKYQPDKYQVVFHGGIGESKLSDTIASVKMELNKTKMAVAKLTGDARLQNIVSQQAAEKINKMEITYGQATYTVNAGTSIVDEINKVVRNSEFFISQLEDIGADIKRDGDKSERDLAATAKKAGKPLKWWKIESTVKLLDFDYTRNCYAREVIYDVRPYEVLTSPMLGVKSNSDVKMIYPHKYYNYIFTGQNVDILNFNLEFNTQYFMAKTSDPNKLRVSSSTAESQTPRQNNSQTAKGDTVKDTLANIRTEWISGNKRAVAGSESHRSWQSQVAGDVQTQLFKQPGADLVTLDLTIIGDPDFIKQDNLFAGSVDTSNALNNSIPMDTREIYIVVNFKTPTDKDEESGLLRSTTNSKFSGLYHLQTINNMFQGGKFTQKLNVVRAFNKEYPDETLGTSETGNKTTTDLILSNPDSTENGAGDGAAVQALAAKSPTITKPGEAIATVATGADIDEAKLAAVGETAPTTSISSPFANFKTPSFLSLYANTKDEQLTYSGDDYIVWDRVNAERLKRGLPSLADIGTPRPPEN